jgi:hypothetical protein
MHEGARVIRGSFDAGLREAKRDLRFELQAGRDEQRAYVAALVDDLKTRLNAVLEAQQALMARFDRLDTWARSLEPRVGLTALRLADHERRLQVAEDLRRPRITGSPGAAE